MSGLTGKRPPCSLSPATPHWAAFDRSYMAHSAHESDTGQANRAPVTQHLVVQTVPVGPQHAVVPPPCPLSAGMRGWHPKVL